MKPFIVAVLFLGCSVAANREGFVQTPTDAAAKPHSVSSNTVHSTDDNGPIVGRIRDACQRLGMEVKVLSVGCPTGWTCPGSATESVVTIQCRGKSLVDFSVFERSQTAIAIDSRWLENWTARSSIWKGSKKVIGVGHDAALLARILGAVLDQGNGGIAGQGFANFELCASRCAADFPKPLIQVFSPWCASMRHSEGACGLDREMVSDLKDTRLATAAVSAYWMGLPCTEIYRKALQEGSGEAREVALAALRILDPEAAHRFAVAAILEQKQPIIHGVEEAFLETIDDADAASIFKKAATAGESLDGQETLLVIRSLGAARWRPGVQWLAGRLRSEDRAEIAKEIIDALGRIGNRESLAVIEAAIMRLPSLKSESVVSNSVCRLSLDWSGDGDIRLRLTKTQEVFQKGDAIHLQLQIDNRSRRSLYCRIRIDADLSVVVDGQREVPFERARFNPLLVSDGAMPPKLDWTWSDSPCHANEMDRISIPAGAGLEPGPHRIYVESKEVKSNVVRVLVR